MYAIDPIIAKIVAYAVYGLVTVAFGYLIYCVIKNERKDRMKKAND